MATRGRPPTPPDLRQDVIISVRVTAQEADSLYQLAARERTTVTELTRAWYRRLLVSGEDVDHKQRGGTWGR